MILLHFSENDAKLTRRRRFWHATLGLRNVTPMQFNFFLDWRQ